MRKVFTAALVAVPLGLYGCGGYGSPSPVSGGLGSAPPGAIVINVVGENGARSFSPNPATVAGGAPVTGHNVDGIDHHIVLDDGEVDSGNLLAGQFSTAMPLVRPG